MSMTEQADMSLEFADHANAATRQTSSKNVRWMGTLVIIFIAALLLEGVLRKWLLTPIQRPLIFIREPLLILIYWSYFRTFPLKKKWLTPFFIYAFFVMFLTFAQNIYWQYPLLVPLMGVRYFIFYIPLAFIMWQTLDDLQLRRILLFLLWVSVPVGILVMLQFLSPVASPINKGVTDDIEGRFTVIEGVIRPYGPFSFVLGQNYFAAMMTAVTLIAIDQRKRFQIGALPLYCGAISTAVMGALSGGRTYFAYLILISLTYVFAGFSSRRPKVAAKRLALIVVFLTGFVMMFVVVFPNAYASMSQRQSNATQNEGSTVIRALSIITDGLDVIGEAPIFGTGVGSGTNAARSSVGVSRGFLNGETEWQRFIFEFGPLFGLMMLGLRVGLTVWLFFYALRLNRARGDGSALILWGFVGPMLATAQVTMQNQMVSFNWLSIGLLLVMAKQGMMSGERSR
ncbi:MAG: hypothetical protein HWE33_02480 [Rhodobacteraceae bacterium]|nr:hypothetical protein [Paracoccaceae bacterium]